MRPRLGLAAILHPFEEGRENGPALLEQVRLLLEEAGADVTLAPEIIQDEKTAVDAGQCFYDARVPVIVLAVITWCADPPLLDLLEEHRVPTVTWAFPGINTGSMCGSQQFGYVLRELDHPCRFVFGEPGDASVRDRVMSFARAAALARELRRTRLGLIGYRVPGMTEVTFDELELKSLLGPRVVHLGVNHLEKKIQGIDEKDARELWETVSDRFGKVSVPESDLVESLKTTLALREWCGEHLLSGAAVACYPELMGRVCLAASILADEGIVIGCEGDMNSTAAMLILSRLTGEPVHNTDPLGVDRKENSIVFSHCGSGSPSLAESRDKIELGHVRLAGEGCCVLFPGKTGRVTLVNLVGRKGTYRMGVFTGLAVATKMVFAGNPTKIVLDGGVDRFLEVVAKEGLGHHWMVAYGDVTEELRELASLVGLETISS